ncbi:DNA polymerase III subunit beta [bacterium]|nr:DNA polymerase III subunit beta [bacterium]
MKFTCSAEALQRGIGAVQNAVGTKISNPIVENIKVEVTQDGLAFYGTNLSLHIRCQVPCETTTPGMVALPTDYLVSTFRELPACDVKVETKGHDVIFRTPSGEVKLRALPADDFPEFEGEIQGASFQLPVAVFKDICRKTLFATSPEKARFELDGVKWVLSTAGTLTCVSTDGRRLSHVARAMEDIKADATALIPSKTLNELARIVPTDGDISITLGKNKAYFECADIALSSALFEDRFPPYEQIIPKAFEISLDIPREPFIHAIRMVGALADDRTKLVKLTLEKGRMILQSEQEQVGDAREELAVDYSGAPMTAGYKASYLLDAMRAIDDATVQLNLINPGSPGVFKSGEMEKFTHVVMPMQISDDV